MKMDNDWDEQYLQYFYQGKERKMLVKRIRVSTGVLNRIRMKGGLIDFMEDFETGMWKITSGNTKSLPMYLIAAITEALNKWVVVQ